MIIDAIPKKEDGIKSIVKRNSLIDVREPNDGLRNLSPKGEAISRPKRW